MPRPSKPKRPYGGRNKLPISQKKQRVVIYAHPKIAAAVERMPSPQRENVLAKGLDSSEME